MSRQELVRVALGTFTISQMALALVFCLAGEFVESSQSFGAGMALLLVLEGSDE